MCEGGAGTCVTGAHDRVRECSGEREGGQRWQGAGKARHNGEEDGGGACRGLRALSDSGGYSNGWDLAPHLPGPQRPQVNHGPEVLKVPPG